MSALVPAPLQPKLAALLALLPSSIPSPLRYAALCLLLLNCQHFPGVWHARIIWPWIKFQWQVKLGKRWPNTRIGKDPLDFRLSRSFRATPDSCDSFGMHLSNSEYAVSLVGEFYQLENASFALGATSYVFKKEIPLMAKFTVTSELLGHDKKWLYIQTRFHSPDDKTTYAYCLSHVVLKHKRRTIPPARAFALAGYGADGAANWEIVQTLNAHEKLQWLIGEGEGEKKGGAIRVADAERAMEGKGEWPGQL
ncbi:SPOSA6832_04701 [Sporobolomyces salmonicolor]|uniref:SPOSA6832_04701-mRNA-1:cds n=1 Tax=Sporidiobolus salmonicolor TaxID=5005 RepID=A0A0D6ES98_SPOSA|nr:SPOSA6832_04701 [Sporobolomyces salmonicolor]